MATRELKATVFYEAGELTYNFPFDYIKKKFVCIKYVDKTEADYIDKGIDLTYGEDYFVDDKKITLINRNNVNAFICIYRKTPIEPINVYNDGSLLKSERLNISNIQLIHLYEELNDYAIIHKVPSGLLQQIEEAVESTKNNANLVKGYLDNVLNVYELIKEKVEEALIYTQSVNVKSFDTVNKMIYSGNISVGNLIRTKGYYNKLDGKGSLYTIEEYPIGSNTYIKLANGLYAVKINDEIDTNTIIYNGINLTKIINTFINFMYIRGHLIFTNSSFVIEDMAYIKPDIFKVTKSGTNKIVINIMKEG